MTEKLNWLRLWTDIRHDGRVQLLAFEDQRHFIMVLTMKRDGTLDGDYGTPDLRERVLAKELGLSPDKAAEAKRRMIEVGLIDDNWEPLRWEKRQFASDSSTSRTRAWRERKAKESSDGDETSRERHGDALEQNRTEQIQNRAEGEGLTLTPPEPDAKPASRKRAANATRLPTPYPMTLEHADIAAAEGIQNPEREFARFVDYWHAASGANARKHDWIATWRNWCRRVADDAAKESARRPENRMSRADAIRARQREAMANARR